MVEINKEYPICDTDIWIKNAKHKKYFSKDLIFSKYKKIYMSDAVRQEIGRPRNDEKKKDFDLGLTEYTSYNGDKLISMIKLNDNKIFNEEMRKSIDIQLNQHKIVYDYKTGRYESTTRDLGETITVIVASMLEIPIVLSDESKSSSILRKYPYLDIRNIIDLLKIHHGDDEQYLQNIRRKLSTPIKENPQMFARLEQKKKTDNKLSRFKNKYVARI